LEAKELQVQKRKKKQFIQRTSGKVLGILRREWYVKVDERRKKPVRTRKDNLFERKKSGQGGRGRKLEEKKFL